MRESNSAIEDVARAHAVSNAYRDALQAISEASILGNEFLDKPSVELQERFDQQTMRAASSLSYIQIHGSDADRALVLLIYQNYAPRLPEVSLAMDAALQGTAAVAFPGQTMIEDLRRLLTGAEQQRREYATARLEQYQVAQEQHTAIIVVGLALGLPVLVGLLILVRVFERREAVASLNMERLELAALTDSLTGLGNHRAYQEELHHSVDEALLLYKNVSLALIDVDEFKEVNDSAGHARGDQILVQMGRLLKEACSPTDKRFRIGGDEFAVIMPNRDEEHARRVMEHFRTLASLTGATVSVGIAQLESGDDTEILREKADATLYTAKRRGRNAVCTFNGDNQEQKVISQGKIKALRDLIRRDTMEIAFQPVRDSRTSSIMGYEALARIPAGIDLDGPQEAFDIAERVGRSHDLDLLCIREGLKRAHSLPKNEVLFLNLSPSTLDNANFSAGALLEMVLNAGLQSHQVCFEITERSTAPIDVVQQEVESLKSLGFKIALDDVGAGNSGLAMMHRLRVDYVKIDRSVLLGAIERGPGRAVLLAIIVFASESGAMVIAEGIETPEMLAVIQETNEGPFAVQGVQGYILGEPGTTLAADLPLTA